MGNPVKAQIQTHRTHQRDDHHGGKDTDVGKPRRALFHPVEHAGYGDKVPRPVVKSAVSFQGAQKQHAARGKEHFCTLYGQCRNDGGTEQKLFRVIGREP